MLDDTTDIDHEPSLIRKLEQTVDALEGIEERLRRQQFLTEETLVQQQRIADEMRIQTLIAYMKTRAPGEERRSIDATIRAHLGL